MKADISLATYTGHFNLLTTARQAECRMPSQQAGKANGAGNLRLRREDGWRMILCTRQGEGISVSFLIGAFALSRLLLLGGLRTEFPEGRFFKM